MLNLQYFEDKTRRCKCIDEGWSWRVGVEAVIRCFFSPFAPHALCSKGSSDADLCNWVPVFEGPCVNAWVWGKKAEVEWGCEVLLMCRLKFCRSEPRILAWTEVEKMRVRRRKSFCMPYSKKNEKCKYSFGIKSFTFGTRLQIKLKLIHLENISSYLTISKNFDTCK